VRAAIASVVAVLLVLPAGAGAQPRSSAELEAELRERERAVAEQRSGLAAIRDDRQAAESELAQIQVRLEDARGRLVAAEGQVALAEAALEDAQERQRAAEEAHRAAESALGRAAAQLEAEEATLVEQLIHTFKYGTVGATRGAMVLEVLRRAEDPNAFAVGLKQLQTVVADQDATVQRVFDLREQRRRLADDAARTRGEAVQAAIDAATTLEVVEGLREEAAAVAQQIATDEARQRSLLDSLRSTEAETASMLERVEAEASGLRTELAEQRRREEEARRRAEEEARRRAEEEARRREASGGSGAPTGGDRLATPGAGGGSDVAGVVCPVVGAVAGRDFTNDWGYPRSGGRYHQGNDIFASRGTPVVAVADGVVTRWNPPSSPTALGGITVTYRIGDGSEWYNAHLDTVAEGIAPGVSVSRGQVIGTVGNTGNARTTPPHLHLGRRQAGGWVNPWPTVAPVCR
jgi:murein DD-endopeptidase MepM/ murein hydrolase activator NlpD